MFDVIGKYNKAIVYANSVDAESYAQVLRMCNLPELGDSQICMMPDMHCRTVTQPVALLFASAAFVAAVTGLILNIRRKEK